jgi:hypothetical protein
MVEVWADSGKAVDIQAAVDQLVATNSMGNVHIPSGTFNFVEVGQPWRTVNLPAGVNVYGAPTQRGANGQVMQWNTILVMPYDVPSGPIGSPVVSWFTMTGNGDPNKPSRFSDIQLMGYRNTNPSSITIHYAIQIDSVLNFRVDHCYFRDTTLGISANGWSARKNSGVIDHNKFINTNGDPGFPVYDSLTCGYGVNPTNINTPLWDSDDKNVLGQYTDYSVYVEDNYFEKWRHCISSNDGAHYVFRYNIINDNFGTGDVDAHGKYNNVGTRAFEIYGNQFLTPDPAYVGGAWAIQIRGGAGVIFNNYVVDHQNVLRMWAEVPQPDKSNPHDVYIWNNILERITGMAYSVDTVTSGGVFENVDYWIGTLNQNADGSWTLPALSNTPSWNYKSYPYPHPLTLEQAPMTLYTPFLEALEQGVYNVNVPPSIVSGSDTYNFKQWEDGSTNPIRTINLTSDMAITATYELLAPPPPGYHHLTIVAYNGTTNPTAGIYEIAEGTAIQVTATPNTGYIFKHWLLDNVIAGLDPTITVAMDADHTLVAVCEAVSPPPKFPVLEAGLGLLGVVGLVYLATRKG